MVIVDDRIPLWEAKGMGHFGCYHSIKGTPCVVLGMFAPMVDEELDGEMTLATWEYIVYSAAELSAGGSMDESKVDDGAGQGDWRQIDTSAGKLVLDVELDMDVTEGADGETEDVTPRMTPRSIVRKRAQLTCSFDEVMAAVKRGARKRGGAVDPSSLPMRDVFTMVVQSLSIGFSRTTRAMLLKLRV